jgi:hypothetical protein
VQAQRGVRGDYFVDRLGGWTQVILAGVSFGIVLARFKVSFEIANVVLALLFFSEIVGAIAITRSKIGPMRFAYWIYVVRVLSAFAYMSVIHGDKLARSTLGFPVIVVLYCWARVRALKERP